MTRAEIVAVSATADIVAGNAIRTPTTDGMLLKQAVVWDGSSPPTTLPLPPDSAEIRATAISGDGSMVMGNVTYADYQRGFRWTRETGLTILDKQFQALDMSYDGSIVVGLAEGNEREIWIDGSAPIALSDYLLGFGFDDPTFRFVDMADDGHSFLGTSANDVVVVTVPEPTAVLLAMIATGVIVRRIRQRRSDASKIDPLMTVTGRSRTTFVLTGLKQFMMS